DLAKAFDTVSHDHIVKSLQRLQINTHFIDVIINLYQQCHTCIEVGKEIEMTSGVKQGDPLSPILFNIAMDPLICDLESSGYGFTFGQEEQQVTALAFADDIALVSQSHAGMAHLLKLTNNFCKKVGMAMNYKKTRGFHIAPKGKTYVVNSRSKWKVDNNEIALIMPGEHEKYLGAYFDPWIGVEQGNSLAKLEDYLKNLESLPLKPGQKVHCLKTFVIPSLLYGLIQSDWKKHTLVDMDCRIRNYLKEVLHLALGTADGLLYSASKDGGLGVQKLESLIPNLAYNKLDRFNKSDERIIHASVAFNGINITTEMTNLLCSGVKKQELARWKELRCQGIGVSYFEDDSVSNSWCTDLSRLKSKHLIAALQLRSNTYPTREFTARGRPTIPKMCRGCGNATEMIGHIIRPMHNCERSSHSKQLINKAERLGWTTEKEPNLIDNQSRLRKPDLIFKKGNQALVVDVTVRMEDNQSSLEKAFQEKVEYYSPLRPQIEKLTGCRNIGFYGFVVGARGKFPKDNSKLLVDLGLPRHKTFSTSISCLSLQRTLDMLQIF
uniref:Reverse transcriptase domain-containing protein n=1 Tax=Latimeria chalumnae TaxID=7897 RepID=H3ALG9_LATCH